MGGDLERLEGEALSDTMDHAAEFAAQVAEHAPARYRSLLESPDMAHRLATQPAFNPGKLFAWAEFLVFRDEFRERFPDATAAACMNAFCRLFLKNDISMSNLARAMEPGDEGDLERLERLGRPGRDP